MPPLVASYPASALASESAELSVLPARGAGRTVLVIFHEEGLGGASVAVLRAIPVLERRGWRFAFWAARPSSLHDELRARGLRADGAPRPFGGYSLRALRVDPGVRARLGRVVPYFKGLRERIRELQPDLVHANSLYSLAEGATARALGLPTVLHVHEMVRSNLKGALARRLAHSLSTIVAADSEACAEALEQRGRARPRIVHPSAPLPEPTRGSEHRSGKLVVGTIGVVSRRKGTDLFVDAARLLRETDADIELRLVGRLADPLEEEWGRAVLERARASGIRHVPRADVPRELSEWDVFVMPSRADPFPLVVLEAMASGLPVIGSSIDGIAEQVTPDTGILVEPEAPRALADAVLELHSDPERRRRLGEAGRARVMTSFSPEREADQLEDAYLAALGDRG